MKYKIGSPVRVKNWAEASKVDGFVKGMSPLCGKPAVVLKIENKKSYKLRPMHVEDLSLDWDWYFTDDMLTEL